MYGQRGFVEIQPRSRPRPRARLWVGLQRRRREAVYRYIERATGPWTDCPVGLAARERAQPPKTQVQGVASDEPGLRAFVVQSEERLAYERTQRLTAMARVGKQLAALEKRVATGKLRCWRAGWLEGGWRARLPPARSIATTGPG